MRERERKHDFGEYLLLQRKEREAPKWERKEKKPSSARAVHHHPNNTTTGERTSFACKNITRFIQIRAFRSRSTFATRDGSGAKHHHFCASFSPMCESSISKERKRENGGPKAACLLCERAFSSFSLDSNESEILLSRMRNNTERPRGILLRASRDVP